MNSLPEIQTYLNTVCTQIRWKKARAAVAEELETHILDQRDAFLAAGLSPEEACAKAVAEMGDAVTVGTMLDHSYRPRIGAKPLAFLLALVLCSCLLPALAFQSDGGNGALSFLVSAAFSIVVALPFVFIDFTWYAKIPRVLLAFLAACLVLSAAGVVFFWRLDSVAAYLLPFASLLLLFHLRGGGLRSFVLCCLAFIVLPCIGYALFFYVRYHGYVSSHAWIIWSMHQSFLVYVLLSVAVLVICVCCGFFAANRKKTLAVLLACTAVFLVLFFLYSARVQLYFTRTGYPEAALVREAVQNTAWLGQGLPVSAPPPDVLTRLLLQIGWLPFFGILAIGAILYGFLLRRCLREKSMLGRSLSLLCWASLTIPTIVGIAGAMGLLPNVSSSVLPFFTTDSSIYASMVLGLLCNIFREGEIVRDKAVNAVA